MEEHEQLNLNRFILKSHLLLKVGGETPYAYFIVSDPRKERGRMAKWFRAREMQSPGPAVRCCVTLGRRLPLSEPWLLYPQNEGAIGVHEKLRQRSAQRRKPC